VSRRVTMIEHGFGEGLLTRWYGRERIGLGTKTGNKSLQQSGPPGSSPWFNPLSINCTRCRSTHQQLQFLQAQESGSECGCGAARLPQVTGNTMPRSDLLQ
ncbi:uncharacterized protein METZ01_LOCUS435761, partial [marine metagenome]